MSMEKSKVIRIAISHFITDYDGSKCSLRMWNVFNCRGADKSLARPGQKQARKHVKNARSSTKSRRELSSIFFFLQSKAPKEIHAILTETLVCFLPDRAKDLSATLYLCSKITNDARCTRDIKSRSAMEKAALNKNKCLLTSELDLKLRKELVKWGVRY